MMGFKKLIYSTGLRIDEPVQNQRLIFDRTFSEYIDLRQSILLSGEYEIEFNFLYDSVDNSFCQLLLGVSGARILLQTTRIIIQYSSSTLTSTNVTIPYNVTHKMVIRRDASNNTYLILNGAAPLLISTDASDFRIHNIGSEAGVRRFLNGYIENFKINGDEWRLQEGSGTVLTSENGVEMDFITNGNQSHIDNNIWETY